ncbi:MAG: DUF5703 domain-containing protein [Mariniphaga sp.]
MRITYKIKTVVLFAMLFANCIAFARVPGKINKTVQIPMIDYRSLISKADLNYTQPVKRSSDGQPIGNGRMGSLIWTNQNALSYQINRVDVFSVNSNTRTFDGTPRDWCGGSGLIDIDFQSNEPVFSDNNFNQHLSCYDGTIETKGQGINTKTLVWNEEDVMAVRVVDTRRIQTPAIVNLHALRPLIVQRARHKAISKLAIIGDKIVLTQEFSENEYYCKSAVAISIPDNKTRAYFARDTEVKLSTTTGAKEYTVLVSSAASFDPKVDVVDLAVKKLEHAASKGFDAMLTSNKDWWHSFWEQSYVQLSSKDGVADYVNKNYIYYLYIMASTSRGDYPVKFNGMLWITDGDTRAWGGSYWGANQSCIYNALLTANKIELFNPMFKMFSSLYKASARSAEQQWGSKGIYIAETIGFNGDPEMPDSIAKEMSALMLVQKPWDQRSQGYKDYAGSRNRWQSRWNNGIGKDAFGPVSHIFSRGAKLAYTYWMDYEYTQDKEWLAKSAYPMIKGTAEFYRNFPNLKKGADGKYHIYHVNDNEPIWDGHNTVEEISSMMGILPVAIKASEILNTDTNLRPLWKELLQNLSPLPMSSEFPELKGQPLRHVKSLLPVQVGGEASAMPDLNTMPVFCFDLCTLESKDTMMLRVANNTFNAYYPNGIKENTVTGTLCMLPIVGAMLGRSEATKYLIPNQMKALTKPVLENRMDQMEGLQATTCERLGRASDALHNALVQSIPSKPGEPTIIRVFPAWPKEWDAQFNLLCRGNFMVSSSYENGEVAYVKIKSQAGVDCTIRNPWGSDTVDIYAGIKKLKTISGDLISFKTKANGQYFLIKKGFTIL